ncbi:MAG: hypothetical protein H7228_04345 [Polaromonas sp.]|nr:hypothetical protein [Polaromonas sp.]
MSTSQTSSRKRLIGWGLTLGVVALAGVAGVAVIRLVPSNEELALRAAAALETAVGIKVSVGAVHWRLFPRPTVVIEDVSTQQAQPIKFNKVMFRPNLIGLWQKRVKFDIADIEGAVIPQRSLRVLGAGKPAGVLPDDSGAGAGAGTWVIDEIPLSQLVFRDVTWISHSGVPAIYSGEVDFDPAWRPRSALIRRPEAKSVTDLTLTRKGPEDRWDMLVHIGGGKAAGVVEIQTQPTGRLHLAGKLQLDGVEVASAIEAFNRRAVISGNASGVTTLTANGDNAGELAQSLHTQTPFIMGPSTLLRFDLSKAVRSLGKEHDGQTPLNAVSGKLDTQNTANGMVIEFNGLKASSGVLTASGKARLLNRNIDAELAVDLVDGVVGIPLKVSGPLEKVSVSVPAGAIAGAVAGTAVLPGVGTAIGARLGAALGNIFSPASEQAKAGTPGQSRR